MLIKVLYNQDTCSGPLFLTKLHAPCSYQLGLPSGIILVFWIWIWIKMLLPESSLSPRWWVTETALKIQPFVLWVSSCKRHEVVFFGSYLKSVEISFPSFFWSFCSSHNLLTPFCSYWDCWRNAGLDQKQIHFQPHTVVSVFSARSPGVHKSDSKQDLFKNTWKSWKSLFQACTSVPEELQDSKQWLPE